MIEHEQEGISTSTSAGRRKVLQAGAAVAGALAVGFPAIVRSQSDKIKIGHLTPLTGFPRRTRRIRRHGHQDGRARRSTSPAA